MEAGDYVKVQMDNDEVWIAEMVQIDETTVDLYWIKKGDDNVYRYSDDCYEISKECILEHVSVSECGNVVKALKEFGLRPLSDCTFAEVEETASVPVGDPAFDNVEDDFVGIHPEMRDFIVPDEEGEAFTFAVADNDFVRDTHKAVRDYNSWHPEGEAQRVKHFIDNMDTRAVSQENARTRLGEALSYANPPVEQKQ